MRAKVMNEWMSAEVKLFFDCNYSILNSNRHGKLKLIFFGENGSILIGMKLSFSALKTFSTPPILSGMAEGPHRPASLEKESKILGWDLLVLLCDKSQNFLPSPQWQRQFHWKKETNEETFSISSLTDVVYEKLTHEFSEMT